MPERRVTITSLLLIVLGVLVIDTAYVGTFGAGYNPVMKCQSPIPTTISSITNLNAFAPILNKRSLNPPCTSYVQLSNVNVIAGSIQWGGQQNLDCALWPSGIYCDTSFNINQTGTGQFNWIHVENDQNWKANGLAPPDIPVQCQNGCRLSITGFVYFDSEHVAANNGNGWEIHPLTSWTLLQ